MKKNSGIVKKIVIVAVMAAGAWGGYAIYNHFKPADAALENQPKFAIVSRETIESVVTAQGKLEPREYVDVGAQVSGQLKKLNVDIGDDVKNGDLIAEIDAEIYAADVDSNAARLKTLQAQLREEVALVKQAKQKLDRNAGLVKTQAISKEVYEDAQTAYQVEQARLASLEAQIDEATSTLDSKKTSLNYTKIYAPMDGTVVVQTAREGQTLNANQTAPVIVQLADLDKMTVRAQVAEADVNKLSVGMPVYFTTLGSGLRQWNGSVRQILPTPETINDVVLYNVLVDVDNKDRQLMTGMSTQMFFVVGKAENTLSIPQAALGNAVGVQDSQGGTPYKVSVKEQGGRLAKKEISVGLVDRVNAQVLSGLQEGDKVEVINPAAASGDKPAAAGGRKRMPPMGGI